MREEEIKYLKNRYKEERAFYKQNDDKQALSLLYLKNLLLTLKYEQAYLKGDVFADFKRHLILKKQEELNEQINNIHEQNQLKSIKDPSFFNLLPHTSSFVWFPPYLKSHEFNEEQFLEILKEFYSSLPKSQISTYLVTNCCYPNMAFVLSKLYGQKTKIYYDYYSSLPSFALKQTNTLLDYWRYNWCLVQTILSGLLAPNLTINYENLLEIFATALNFMLFDYLKDSPIAETELAKVTHSYVYAFLSQVSLAKCCKEKHLQLQIKNAVFAQMLGHSLYLLSQTNPNSSFQIMDELFNEMADPNALRDLKKLNLTDDLIVQNSTNIIIKTLTK